MNLPIPRRSSHLDTEKRCPRCQKTLLKANQATVIVNEYLKEAVGMCNACYDIEKDVIDIERDAGYHSHSWQFTVAHWKCRICHKVVEFDEEDSKFHQPPPPLLLEMEKYKMIPQEIHEAHCDCYKCKAVKATLPQRPLASQDVSSYRKNETFLTKLRRWATSIIEHMKGN